MELLKYIDEGDGFPLVLLHGFGENRLIWQNIQEELAGQYRVICPDLRGFGLTDLSSEGMSIQSMAHDVEALLNHLDIQECIMIGHSMGGYVSLAFAEEFGHRLKGLGLFHSSAFPDSEDKQRNRNRTIEYIQENGVEAFAGNFVKNLFYHKNRERLQSEIEKTIAMVNSTTMEGLVNASKAMRDRKDRSGVLQSADIPVLFIAGKEDGAVPLSASLEQVHLPQDSLVRFLGGVAHMGMFEAPQQSLQTLKAFLDMNV